jgi:methionine-gamma-lyase
MKNFNPADNIQDLQYFGEFGGVNPSISDSTYYFSFGKTMFDTLKVMEGCYLYSRHSSPSNLYLDKALAAMEGTETANVSASGMGQLRLHYCNCAAQAITLFLVEPFMVEHML